ncbi:MAG TPA: phosphoribosylamine--glycine ligase [Candidatus Acidoferrales bacterium]|nr:phosphoribosylamine--glycine ligase [Candidatus Acidoferrales bacterium]
MKVLIIGGGGREHALAWKLRQSANVEHLWCAPGNGGISEDAECVEANLSDVAALANLAEKLKADLTVVGPEQPLVLGVGDEFAKRGLRLVGPSREAARLEGSKVFAKEFMQRHGIPTAATYGIFDSAVDAYTALCEVDWPVVVKADGLCGGKGVLVTSSPDEATLFIERLMEKREFGEAGKAVILEEGLEGREISYIVLTDGENFVPLAPARDYKRAFDGDQGPNTGGMGAISCGDLVSAELEEMIRSKIVRPTITKMAGDGKPFKGFLYFGLMITGAGPKVLEFNCRLGDPETEALAMRMNFDLCDALERAASGDLKNFKMSWEPKASACVVCAARGYPGKPEAGQRINGLKRMAPTGDVAIFHSGTRKDGGHYYTHSGRVLTVAARAESLSEVRRVVYEAAKQISFEGMHYRKDIGREAGEVAHG